jgi:hypothetical protein
MTNHCESNQLYMFQYRHAIPNFIKNSLIRDELIDTINNEHGGRVVNSHASYSGGLQF